MSLKRETMRTLVDSLASALVAAVLFVCAFFLDLRLSRIETEIRECRSVLDRRYVSGCPSITVPGPYPPVGSDLGSTLTITPGPGWRSAK